MNQPVVDKTGRVDLLALGIMRKYTERAEVHYDMPGLWEAISPMVEQAVKSVIKVTKVGKEELGLLKFVGEQYVRAATKAASEAR